MTDLPHGRINPRSSIPFFVVHLLPLLAIFTGVPATAWILCAVTFWGRTFFLTAGYHRYFSHRSYRTSRASQLLPAPSTTRTPRARASGGAMPGGSSPTRPHPSRTGP